MNKKDTYHQFYQENQILSINVQLFRFTFRLQLHHEAWNWKDLLLCR